MKKMLTVFLAVALLCACAVPAGAVQSSQAEAVHATLWQWSVWIENEQMAFLNEQGGRVSLFSYNGTVYMPVRTAGEWIGCTVGWDQATQTVNLAGHGDALYHKSEDQRAGTDEELAALLEERQNGMNVQLRPDISVVVDSVKQSFTNVKGEAVYPAVYKSVTYLPVRNIGELCGKEVTWVPGAQEAIYLHEPLTEAQHTEIKNFIAESNRIYDSLSATVSELTETDNFTDDEALELLSTAKSYLQELQKLDKPTALITQERVQFVLLAAEDMEREFIDSSYSRIKAGEPLAEQSGGQFGVYINISLKDIRSNLDTLQEFSDAL